MSLVFFLFVTALFLFFFANFILSPERNPRFTKLMEAEHAPSQEVVSIIVALCNGAALGLAVVLVVAVPFLRVLAAMAMVGWTIRFFHRRHFSTKDFAGTSTNATPSVNKADPLLTHMLDEAELTRRELPDTDRETSQ